MLLLPLTVFFIGCPQSKNAACPTDGSDKNGDCVKVDNDDGTKTIVCPDGTRVTVGSDGTDTTDETDGTGPVVECVVSADCADGDPCTVELCGDGACLVTAAPLGSPCDDGDPCTDFDQCSGTTLGCTSKTKTDCDDGNPCTLDNCVEAGCVYTYTTDLCDDADYCTEADACDTGQCVGQAVECDDGDACNGLESCEPLSGCAAGQAMACDDGNPCTSDQCAEGTCQNTPVPGCGCLVDADCDDGDACNGLEVCAASACTSGAALADGAQCDDADFCTHADECKDGKCAGTPYAPNSSVTGPLCGAVKSNILCHLPQCKAPAGVTDANFVCRISIVAASADAPRAANISIPASNPAGSGEVTLKAYNGFNLKVGGAWCAGLPAECTGNAILPAGHLAHMVPGTGAGWLYFEIKKKSVAAMPAPINTSYLDGNGDVAADGGVPWVLLYEIPLPLCSGPILKEGKVSVDVDNILAHDVDGNQLKVEMKKTAQGVYLITSALDP